MRRPGHLRMAVLFLTAAACVGAEDDPSTVRDLRVLGVSLNPPELMAPSCEGGVDAALAVAGSPVAWRALVVDPAGEGRNLDWELLACANAGDRVCAGGDDAGDRVVIASGSQPAGEWQLPLVPGTLVLQNGQSILLRVFSADAFGGLGGLRVPLVLRVRGGDEQVFAQKLMVYSCKAYPESEQNLLPMLPGVRAAGNQWPEGVPMPLSGAGPFPMEPEPFDALEESYVVPSLSLAPVFLQESWKVAWHTTLGTVSPSQTGGTDLAGEESRAQVEWLPPAAVEGQTDVTFWLVVRDGRGGLTWTTRQVRYTP
ncbi:MAG: hypothetical protein ACKVPX_06305 [Myxococcaceae bacterium]